MRFPWLERECTYYSVCILCCGLCRAECIFCFLFDVCAFSRGSSCLCFTSGSVTSYTLLWLVSCVHTHNMALHVDFVLSHVICWNACKHHNILHRNFNNVLEHIWVLMREATDWLCLVRVFFYLSRELVTSIQKLKVFTYNQMTAFSFKNWKT